VKNKPTFLSNKTHIKFIPVKEYVQLYNSDLINWNSGFSSRHEGFLLIVLASPTFSLLINTSTYPIRRLLPLWLESLLSAGITGLSTHRVSRFSTFAVDVLRFW